jgi:hypothetical protein
MKAFLFFLFFCVALSVHVKSQKLKTDSLQHVLTLNIDDKERLEISLLLADHFSKVNPLLALKYAEEGVRLANKLNSDSLLAQAYLVRVIRTCTSEIILRLWPHTSL